MKIKNGSNITIGCCYIGRAHSKGANTKRKSPFMSIIRQYKHNWNEERV